MGNDPPERLASNLRTWGLGSQYLKNFPWIQEKQSSRNRYTRENFSS
jgi:hypothetical protein